MLLFLRKTPAKMLHVGVSKREVESSRIASSVSFKNKSAVVTSLFSSVCIFDSQI